MSNREVKKDVLIKLNQLNKEQNELAKGLLEQIERLQANRQHKRANELLEILREFLETNKRLYQVGNELYTQLNV